MRLREIHLEDYVRKSPFQKIIIFFNFGHNQLDKKLPRNSNFDNIFVILFDLSNFKEKNLKNNPSDSVKAYYSDCVFLVLALSLPFQREKMNE